MYLVQIAKWEQGSSKNSKTYKLKNIYWRSIPKKKENILTCNLKKNVFNLITKEKYWHTTYQTLQGSLM